MGALVGKRPGSDVLAHRSELPNRTFSYRSGMMAGMLAAALGGLDAFVFTAGVGENSALIRARIAAKLNWLGAEIDHAANEKGTTCIAEHIGDVQPHLDHLNRWV